MNITILTDMPPCKNFTAGIVIAQLCQFLLEENHKISCFAVVDPALSPEIPDDILSKMPYKRIDKPRESWGAGIGGACSSFYNNNRIALFTLPTISSQAAAFALENKADIIWSIVQGQTMIKIVRKASQLADIPYTVQVWDPPQWWLSENQFDQYTFNSVMHEFGLLLKNSQCCQTASWFMAEEYSKLYGARCVPVIPGLDENKKIEVKNKAQTGDKFIIGFSGQLYAIDEFNLLINALNSIKWQHNNKSIELAIYGSYFTFNFKFSSSANICIKGWRSQDDLLSELATTHLLYCPYWFSEKFSLISRLSFPSKLTSYLKTKTPVIVHAPEYASTYKFIKENNAGYIFTKGNSDKLATYICNIIDDSDRINIGERGYELYLKELTFKKMKKNFFKSLGIDS